MSEKPVGKSKELIQADLNFVSQKSLDSIVHGLEQHKERDIQSQIVRTNDDTALFHLKYSRENRITAEVSGRLKRWAGGDMTHVYCDGRSFEKKMSQVKDFIGWFSNIALVSPFVLCPMAMLTGSDFLFGLAIYAFVAAVIASLFTGFYSLMWVLKLVGNRQRIQHLNKPEKKDRERLLQFVTSVIRDDDFADNLELESAKDDTPLTDEEIAAIVAASKQTNFFRK